MAKKQWEYRIVQPAIGSSEIDVLNQQGQQGWEAWAQVRCPIDGSVAYYLKRPRRKVKFEKTTKVIQRGDTVTLSEVGHVA